MLIIPTGCLMKPSVTPEEKTYHILLLFSYASECGWTQQQYTGITDCLHKHSIHAKVDSFHINADLLSESKETDTLNRLLERYENNPPDLIITCDDQATYSLQATRHPLTYKIPIVFCGVDYLNRTIMEGRSNITGFTTEPDYVKCYELAQQLFGNITSLHVITDPTYLGRLGVADLCRQVRDIPNLASIVEIKNVKEYLDIEYDTLFVNRNVVDDPLNIRILRLDLMTARVMKWAFSNQPGVVSLMPRWSTLYSGVARTDNIPFLMVNDEGFGDGRLGGYMTGSYNQTYQAMETGIRILKGEDPASLPIQQSNQTPAFDWRQLNHWKISLDRLPADNVIINMPFYVKYRAVLWSAGISFGVLIALVLLILNQLYRKEKFYKKVIENTLVKEQNELNITMNSISDGVILVDNDRKIKTINQSALNWLELGDKEEDYEGRSLESLLDIRLMNNPAYLENLFDRISQTSSIYILDTLAYLVTPGGLSFPVSGTMASIHSDDNRQGMIITFRNIIDEMAQKEFLDLCITTGDVFVWKYDPVKQIFTYDNVFFVFLEWPESETGELPFSSFLSFLHPDDLPVWEDAMRVMSGGQQLYHSIQIRLQTGGGAYSWWEYRIIQEPNQVAGEYTSFFGLCLNIDYLKKKEKELEEIRDNAEEADRQKTIFLSNMSHEIRTPLNAIVGFSELLIDMEDLTVEDRKGIIGIINNNCRLLLNLVNDILDISRIESGITFKREPCELNSLILEIAEANKEMCPKEVTILTELPKLPVTLWSDNYRIRQILNNLLNNALKFTTQGSVTIGYQWDNEHRMVRFSVRDTGCGILPEEQAKIFERFYKSDDFSQGGGLGLPICNEIVRRMHGSITLESEPGIGTCFYVTLPEKVVEAEGNNRKDGML